ncbi:MAG TPA: hypothetical protein VJW94_04955 [Candidatus Acidoferrum sp.]|nr:hypothetical protein [Candidatus Acidoferrum sp.]
MAIGYLFTRTLRFTNEALNLTFVCLYFLLPFFAIRSVLRLRRWPKLAASIFLVPLLAISTLCLLLTATCEIPAVVEHRELSREVATLRMEHCTVHLLWQETAGGAVGPHGVGLEQRMFLVPGLYLVKHLDYFEGAHEGSLLLVGNDKVRVHVPKSDLHQEVDKVYALKRRVYF